MDSWDTMKSMTNQAQAILIKVISRLLLANSCPYWKVTHNPRQIHWILGSTMVQMKPSSSIRTSFCLTR